MDKPSTWEMIGYTLVDILILIGLASIVMAAILAAFGVPVWLAKWAYRGWHWIVRDRGKHEDAS